MDDYDNFDDDEELSIGGRASTNAELFQGIDHDGGGIAMQDPAYQIGFEDGRNKGQKALWPIIECQDGELNKRAAIIAEKVLGWKQYYVDGNNEQMAYGSSEEAVKTLILVGDKLTKLVDNAIDAMSNPADPNSSGDDAR